MKYYQFIQRILDDDYIMTRRFIDGVWEDEPIQGCRVVQATLSGKSNPAQEQGSALTYARRYSLLMAFGLATEDDDAESLTQKNKNQDKTEQDLDEKVTDVQAKSIYSLMKRKGIDVVASLQQNYGISNTSDLTIKQFNTIFQAMNKLPDKEKGE